MKKKFKCLCCALVLSMALAISTAAVACSGGHNDSSSSSIESVDSSVILNKTNATIKQYETLTLEASLSGYVGATVWSSSDSTIASVENGVVTGLKAGKVIITAACGQVLGTCEVTVVAATSFPVLQIGRENVTMKRGDSVTFSPKITLNANTFKLPEEANVVSDNPNAIEVSRNVEGTVTLKAVGVSDTPVVVTFSLVWRGAVLEESVSVTITADAAVNISETSLTLSTYDNDGADNVYGVYTRKTLTATVFYENVEVPNPQLEWTTDNAAVAAVENGVVTAVAEGVANVTAKWTASTGETASATCVVTVEIGKIDLGTQYVYLHADDGKTEIAVNGLIPDAAEIVVKDCTDDEIVIDGTVSNGKLVLNASDLVAGVRNFEILYKDKLVLLVQAKVVTKIIKTADELIHILSYAKVNGERYEGYFELADNIDLTGKDVDARVSDTYTNGDDGYVLTTSGFSGTFDGMGYTVYGGTYYKNGIFGLSVADTGVIKNVAFTNATMNDQGVVSQVLCGYMSGRVENVLVDISTNAVGYGSPMMHLRGSLVNFVGYNVGQNDPGFAIANYPWMTASATNVYAFTDYKSDSGYFTSLANIQQFGYNTSCKEADFIDLDDSVNGYWNLSGKKAYFKSVSGIFRGFIREDIKSIPDEIYSGSEIELPKIDNVTYDVTDTYATVNGNLLSVAMDITNDFTLSLDVYYKSVLTQIVKIEVVKFTNIVLETTERYVVYTGLSGDARVQNTQAFTIDLDFKGNLPADMLWSVNGKDITQYVRVNGDKVTVDAVAAGLYGKYQLSGRNDAEKFVVRANIFVVTAVLTTKEEVLAYEKFLDVTKTGMVGDKTLNRTEGYLELGADIDLGAELLEYSIDLVNDVGNAEYGFNGTFDGCGHTLFNGKYALGGMFGLVGADGVIKNVAFTNVTMSKGTANKDRAQVLSVRFYGELADVLIEQAICNEGIYTQGVATFLCGAKLTNVVVYMPVGVKGAYSATAAIAQYATDEEYYGSTGLTTFTNCYVFTDVTDGVGNGIGSLLSGTQTTEGITENVTSAQASVVNGVADCFNISLDKVYFANYAKTLVNAFETEFAAMPVELYQGASVILPTIPYASYSVSDTATASVVGNMLTAASELDASKTITLIVDLSAYGAENRTFEVLLRRMGKYVKVEETQKYELYTGLNAGERVKNTSAFTISANVSETIPDNLIWKLGDIIVTDFVIVNGNDVTLNVFDVNVGGGRYKLIGRASDDGFTIEIDVILVNKIITTAEDLLAWEKYGDKTNETTVDVVINLRNPNNANIAEWNGETGTHVKTKAYTINGYFELGANIDLTGKTVDGYSCFSANKDTKYGLNGTFDGCGYTVSGGTYLEGGLFGAISVNGVLKNIALTDITISTSSSFYYGLVASAVAETVSGRMENVLVDITAESWTAASGRNCAVVTAVAEFVYGAEFENCVFYLPFVHEGVAVISYQGTLSSAINVYAIGCDDDNYRRVTVEMNLFEDGYFLYKASDQVSFADLDSTIWDLTEDKATFKTK